MLGRVRTRLIMMAARVATASIPRIEKRHGSASFVSLPSDCRRTSNLVRNSKATAAVTITTRNHAPNRGAYMAAKLDPTLPQTPSRATVAPADQAVR